jgi:uncharacterized protein YecE (DUF72 family)
MTTPSPIRCGPAGWAYSHWNGIVYPKPRPRGFHELEYLSHFFDAVEVNTTFYQALRPEIPSIWLKKVRHNPGFQFTVKLNRRFSHERDLDQARIDEFKQGLFPLKRAGKLGCLLMQFPWSFRFTEENRDYLIRLRRAFHEFPLAAEMRHASWMLEEALGVFIDHRIGFVNIDQPEYMRAMPATAILTSGVGYFRFHGRRMHPGFQQFEPAGPEQAGGEYLYSPLELADWRTRIERVARHAAKTFVVMNNDAAGRSVVNALQMQRVLGISRDRAPADLMRYYARVLPSFSPGIPTQRELFSELAPPANARRKVA